MRLIAAFKCYVTFILNYRTDRVTLSYDMVGSQDMDMIGQKPPIIFLHGMTSAKETWKNVIRPIAVATGRKVSIKLSKDFYSYLLIFQYLKFIKLAFSKYVLLEKKVY